MKRELNDLHLDKAALPMPKDCYDTLMNAARSVKEEEPVKKASFHAALIAAIIIVATTAVAFAAQQLGWADFYGQMYGITLPKAAEGTLNATQPVSYEAGPMTFTFQQLMTDKCIVLSAATVRMTDGSEALLANGLDLYEAVDAISDTVLKKHGLAPGTTWVEAANQLDLPLYGVRALAEVAPAYDGGEAMESALWNEDGSIVYLNMHSLNKDAVQDELPVTLYMAVHAYDPTTQEIQTNAYTARKEAVVSAAPLLAEKTYTPESTASLAVPLYESVTGSDGKQTAQLRCEISMTLQSIYAEQYATGIYLTGTFIVNGDVSETDAREALYKLQMLDANGNELPMGISLSGEASLASLPEAELEIMTSLETLPERLMLTDGTVTLSLK